MPAAPAPIYRAVRIVSAAILVATALFHLSKIANDPVRHAIFVGVNVALAALLVHKPRMAFVPTLLLGAQQMYSHGLDLSRSFLGTAPLDKVSLAVCLFFPTLATLLYMERQE
jgi:hypothetical protein